MISFLIPIYNRDVNRFVNTLFEQCEASGVAFEILLYDDFSTAEYRSVNQNLSQLIGVSYMEMSKNFGRSRIRNWLGKNARYEHLVFMDCDSMIEKDDFVQKYLDAMHQADVVYGGTSYQKSTPDLSYRLHWNYGRRVEAKPFNDRQKMPYRSFRSNNFMIRKSVFLKHLFDDSIEGYGYEDNALGESLRAQQYSILHIDNPLLHDGIETNERFMLKTEEAIRNLVGQYKDGQLRTRLTDQYERWKDLGILSLFEKYSNTFARHRKTKLIQGRGSILSFQLYKMQLFIHGMKQES